MSKLMKIYERIIAKESTGKLLMCTPNSEYELKRTLTKMSHNEPAVTINSEVANFYRNNKFNVIEDGIGWKISE